MDALLGSYLGDGDVFALECLFKGGLEVNTSVCGVPMLHLAAMRGNIQNVRLLISKGTDIHALDKYGRTALMAAAECKTDNTEVVTELIQAGVVVNYQSHDQSKQTALHIACQFSAMETVRSLISNGAELNVKNGRGDMPIHIAAYHGNIRTVVLLITIGADVGARSNGQTPLMYAAACPSDNIKVIIQLIRAGVSINAVSEDERQRTALHIACQVGTVLNVNALIDNIADMNAQDWQGDTAVHIASRSGKATSLTVLQSRGANVQALGHNGRTALMAAAEYGMDNSKVIASLIQADVAVNAVSKDEEKQTALHIASRFSATETVRTLLEHDSNINADNAKGSKAIHIAACYGKSDVVALLISRGADINALDSSGLTALMHAAAFHSDNTTIINQLIKAGLPVDAVSQDEDKETALHIACQFSTVETAKALIDNGAGVNVPNGFGDFPIHHAVRNGKSATLDFLLASEANAHALGHNGRTTLMAAAECESDNKNVITHLIKSGVSVNAISQYKDKTTALHIACKTSTAENVKVLIDNGARLNVKDGAGDKPMHIASALGREEIVTYFINRTLNSGK